MGCRGLATAPLGSPPPTDMLDSDLAYPRNPPLHSREMSPDYSIELLVRINLPMILT